MLEGMQADPGLEHFASEYARLLKIARQLHGAFCLQSAQGLPPEGWFVRCMLPSALHCNRAGLPEHVASLVRLNCRTGKLALIL